MIEHSLARTETWRRPRTHARAIAATTLWAGIALAVAIAPPLATATPAPPGPSVDAPRDGFADLVERVQPAVVLVSTRTRLAAAGMATPLPVPGGVPMDHPFREFFERFNQGRQAPETTGVGSGFIVDPDGFVVTNNHVIDGASEVTLTLYDGTVLPARVVGRDPKTDLALLKVDSEDALPYVSFGDSHAARVGDWVVAVGSPFGLGGTVTAGIISARGRNIHSGPFDDFLQVDAPINRGNSGGPLFDRSGRVIGVNTAIFSPSGGNVGIGFAIPSAIAADVVTALKRDGRVERGWMGVAVQTVTEDLADGLGLDEPQGALVVAVTDGSPASSAGLQPGDVIVAFDGTAIEQMRDLPRVVAAARAGDRVAVRVWRDGSLRSLSLRIGPMPTDPAQAAADTDSEAGTHPTIGLVLGALDARQKEPLGLPPGTQGVLITDVVDGSPAARKGLRRGDVIVRVGKHPVSTPEQVAGHVRDAALERRAHVLILVSRRGDERFVAVPFARG